MKRKIQLLILAGTLTLASVRLAIGDDVVPPSAVEVAEAWWGLVDQGRYREAVDAYFVASASRAVRDSVARSLAVQRDASSATVKYRTISAWLETPDRAAPLGYDSYFVMRFDTFFTSARPGIDELRMVRQGEDRWRIIGVIRKPPPQ